MSKPKFKRGRKIESVSDFSRTSCQWFIVNFGRRQKTLHRSFIVSWQYYTLETFIKIGMVYVADPIADKEETQ